MPAGTESIPDSTSSNWYNSSAQRKLALLVTLLSLLFALIAGVISFYTEFSNHQSRAHELQEQLVKTVYASAAVAAFSGDKTIANEVIDGLLANRIIDVAMIESDNGFSIARSRQGVLIGNIENTNVYALLSPVDKASKVGRLLVRRDSTWINLLALTDATSRSGLLMLQIMVTALLLILLVKRIIGRPLTQIALALRTAEPGSSYRIPYPHGHQHDEIGSLVTSGNSLLSTVENAIQIERDLRTKVDQIETHYKRVFETTNIGIMILDRGGQLINGNQTLLTSIVGQAFDPAHQLAGETFLDKLFRDPEKAWLLIHKAWEAKQSIGEDLRLRTHDGNERWVHCIISALANADNRMDTIEGVLYDVTERHRRESANRKLAELDALTGLHNRHALEVFLDSCLMRAAEDKSGFAVMLLDLDGFKSVNDNHGHAAGDEVLVTVARRLRKCINRASDFVARLGGDEFVVAIYDHAADPGMLDRIAREIIDTVRQSILLENGSKARVGASIGIACYPEHGYSRSELLAAADDAMYRVKSGGKNGYLINVTPRGASCSSLRSV